MSADDSWMNTGFVSEPSARSPAPASTATGSAKSDPDLAPIPRIYLRTDDAAAYLMMSPSSFEEHVRDHVPRFKRGRLVIYRIEDLDRFVASQLVRPAPPRDPPALRALNGMRRGKPGDVLLRRCRGRSKE